MQRVLMFSPLPPARTGIAHYSAMLLPALRERVEVEAIDSPGIDNDYLTTDDRQRTATNDHRSTDNDQRTTANGQRPTDKAPRIYHLGNNPHHEWIYREAMRVPGVVVLHDLVLHHLIVEMTLARGDADGYAAALRASHGAAGEAWARGRAAGLHSEMGNFLLPASVDVARRSRAVIVHNQWAAGRLQSFGVTTPILVVPHPFEPQPSARGRREEVRRRHGYDAGDRVIGLFGFLTSAKRSEVILAAFAAARARDAHLRLLVVGEPAPNIDIQALQDDGITFTGYVEDVEFAAHFAAVDRLVNLRYPSAGETSGTLIRAFEAEKPVAVSDYAQFAELPDDCVVKIPFGDREIEQLADFFLRDLPDPAAAQKQWLDEHASMEKTVAGYLATLHAAADGGSGTWSQVAGTVNQERLGISAQLVSVTRHPAPGIEHSVLSTQHSALPVTASLPLFPQLELIRVELDPLTIELQNAGEAILRTHEYGQPGYRLIVKLFDGATEIYDRWVELPRDLAAGERTTVTLPVRGRGTLALYHALEGVPMLEPEAFARAAL
jgi:glycosyltransferase involved in cell wall biosynthesis